MSTSESSTVLAKILWIINDVSIEIIPELIGVDGEKCVQGLGEYVLVLIQ